KIRLQEQPLQLLEMLLESPGEVVTREELRQALWPGDTFVDFDHGLNNAINRLREALNDSAETPRFIETLPRRGYRFVAEVTREPAAQVPAVAPTDKATGLSNATVKEQTEPSFPSPLPSSRRSRKFWLKAAIVSVPAALILGYVGYKQLFGSSAAMRI